MYHCGIARHNRPNYYNWLARQKNNGGSSPRRQSSFQDSMPPFGELIKALYIVSNLQGYSSPPSPPKCRPQKKRNLSPQQFAIWKEKEVA